MNAAALLGQTTTEWALNVRHQQAALGEARACGAVVEAIRTTNLPLWEELQRRADETTYSRRHYGRGQFYVWAHHPELGGHDPWPAVRFPRAAVCWDHLMALCEQAERQVANSTEPPAAAGALSDNGPKKEIYSFPQIQ